MSRVLRAIGVPNADGEHCNFLPFHVEQLGALTPDNDTPGEWALISGLGYVLCVNRGDLAKCFGLYRRWKTRFSMSGQYVAYDVFGGPGSLTSFSLDTGTDPAVDVVKPTFTGDERYLGHGRTIFLAESGTVSPTVNFAAVMNLGYTTANDFLDPSNATKPLLLFDENPYSAGQIITPVVYYSNVLDAYYITLAGGSAFPSIGNATAAITVRFSPSVAYDIQWTAGPPTGDPFSAVYNAHFAPFGDIPGNITWPEDFEPVIDEFILSVEATDTAGYFPHKKLDDTAPVWDEDSGAQLITPVPMVQD